MVNYSHDGMASEILETLGICGTRGRPGQVFWEFRVLVDTSLINLALGEIFYCCKGGSLELGFPKALLLDSRVLRDEELNECRQQCFASLADVMHKLEETERQREFFL